MVDWLAGNRVRGTSTERTTSAGFNDGFTGVGGWKELARTTLGSNTTPITVSSLPDKRYYMVLKSWSGNTGVYERFNNDGGSNYAGRRNQNGGSDSTLTSQAGFPWANSGYSSSPNFVVDYISNISDKEKLIHRNWVMRMASGAGTAPDRVEFVGKWANTSAVINRMDMAGGNNYDSGSEMVVLGWDDSDTHTTNFWEELASVNGTGATSFNSGVFTSKKYLWVQMYIDRSADATNGEITVGNTTLDTGSNYSRRRSADGGADDTLTSQTKISLRTAGLKEFYNMFIINNSANEKLIIFHQNAGGTAGAGNAPYRGEFVAKWANTSSQIDIIGFGSGGSNTLSSTSTMKVWGSD